MMTAQVVAIALTEPPDPSHRVTVRVIRLRCMTDAGERARGALAGAASMSVNVRQLVRYDGRIGPSERVLVRGPDLHAPV
jgi:hypothetical protein